MKSLVEIVRGIPLQETTRDYKSEIELWKSLMDPKFRKSPSEEKLDRVRDLIAERINQAEINFRDDRLAMQLREIRDAAGL